MFDCYTTCFGNPGVMVLDLQKLLDKLLVRDLQFTSYLPILFEPSTNIEDHKISTKVDNHVNHFCDAGVMALDLQKIYLVIIAYLALTFKLFGQTSFRCFHKW